MAQDAPNGRLAFRSGDDGGHRLPRRLWRVGQVRRPWLDVRFRPARGWSPPPPHVRFGRAAARPAQAARRRAEAIEELTEGSYAPSPGTIYPTLALLEDEGAIAQAAGDETRKAYEATAAGRTELEERADEVAALFERLSGHGEHRRAYATPEMFRAVGNLANVLKNRARSGKLDEETVQEIVDLVDDLAKKIERL